MPTLELSAPPRTVSNPSAWAQVRSRSQSSVYSSLSSLRSSPDPAASAKEDCPSVSLRSFLVAKFVRHFTQRSCCHVWDYHSFKDCLAQSNPGFVDKRRLPTMFFQSSIFQKKAFSATLSLHTQYQFVRSSRIFCATLSMHTRNLSLSPLMNSLMASTICVFVTSVTP